MSLLSLPDLGPWPALGYQGSPLDRAAHLRGESAALAKRDDARFYLLGGEGVALHPGEPLRDPLFTAEETAALDGGKLIFLGLADGTPRFAARFDPAGKERMELLGLQVPDLRSTAVQGLVSNDHLAALACGKAMLAWHGRHRFCANCGTRTRSIEGGWRRDCPSCGAQHFPRTDPVVIMLTYDGDQCLMGRAPHFAPEMWSCLAGFVEPGETIEEAVRRETLEETGVTTGAVRYRSCQPWPYPMSLMFGCMAQATSRTITMDAHELAGARWFSREETAKMLVRAHPEGLFVPPANAIAHHLIRAFVEGETV
ncbi:NAD(+) diphosphatase [Xanthobacter sp. DSM 24535]|uniref:NAD(+) diphosphatase n=1 Tax=Roseixanthobacter psychrophilus TaxID=3119917 RepID=UPI0037269D6B